MNIRKTSVMAMVTLLITLCFSTVTYAGVLSNLLASKLDNPTRFECQWEGDNLSITWNNVANAGSYKVTYNGKAQEVHTPSFTFKPTKLTGSISVQSLPSAKGKKYKASTGTNYSYSAKILPAPSKYTYYQDGKVIVYSFLGDDEDIDRYEITSLKTGDTGYIPADNTLTYWISQGESFITDSINVCSLPSTDKKNVKSSQSVTIPISLTVWDYLYINTPYEAALLSEADLETWWIKSYGITPTINEQGDYTTVTFSLKDSNNGLLSKADDVIGAAFDGAVNVLVGSSDDILYDTIEGEDLKDMGERAKASAGAAAAKGALDNLYKNGASILANTDIHYSYIYKTDETNYSAKYMTKDYVVKNNSEPSQYLSKMYYDDNNQCYRSINEQFNRFIKYSYEKKSVNGKNRWIINAEPGSPYKTFSVE